MKKIDKNALENAAKKIWPDDDLHDLSISVSGGADSINIRVSQMYEFVPFSYLILKKLEAATGCEDIDVDQYASGGCETCDYGSSYEVTFTLKNCKLA
jgi:hypothetical protein